ncbi:MAG TPA: sigma-70 family RNA polymerase sigma factor [Allosphingosinicella sp.]|nr:sigma-70 family RNA polymerase sigma factor [Allosphingosinicella sp.]
MARDGPAGRALDEYLVASARIGDRKAFRLLVERWHGRLLAHAWRLLGNTEEAREAVQDGWAEIVPGLKRLADTRAFPAWAYRIVSRRCAKLVGQAHRRRRLDAAVAAEPAEAAAPGETAGGDIERLRRAIASLPAEQRATVSLFHLEEMSVAEVAVALDVPAGTVKTRLMHARRKLRAALEGEDDA